MRNTLAQAKDGQTCRRLIAGTCWGETSIAGAVAPWSARIALRRRLFDAPPLGSYAGALPKSDRGPPHLSRLLTALAVLETHVNHKIRTHRARAGH